MRTRKKARTRASKEKHGLSKIASFTKKSITTAISNYKKNKEQNKIRAIKLQKLEERTSLLKEKKDLKAWEDKLIKESNKLKVSEDEVRLKEYRLDSISGGANALCEVTVKVEDARGNIISSKSEYTNSSKILVISLAIKTFLFPKTL